MDRSSRTKSGVNLYVFSHSRLLKGTLTEVTRRNEGTGLRVSETPTHAMLPSVYTHTHTPLFVQLTPLPLQV